MKECYISVDVETSGPIPGKYSMLSIGACVIGDTSTTFYVELRPVAETFIPAAMETVGKPMDHFSQHGQEPREGMKSFRSWIESVSVHAVPVFVGFNAAFDWSFINWYFLTYLDENPFGFSSLDIKSFYMGLIGCSWEETRSSKVNHKFKSNTRHTHDALHDAVEQGEMFKRMLQASRPAK